MIQEEAAQWTSLPQAFLSSESITGFGLGIWLISLIPIAYFGSHPDQYAAKLELPRM
jgi:hypothetical protein